MIIELVSSSGARTPTSTPWQPNLIRVQEEAEPPGRHQSQRSQGVHGHYQGGRTGRGRSHTLPARELFERRIFREVGQATPFAKSLFHTSRLIGEAVYQSLVTGQAFPPAGGSTASTGRASLSATRSRKIPRAPVDHGSDPGAVTLVSGAGSRPRGPRGRPWGDHLARD